MSKVKTPRVRALDAVAFLNEHPTLAGRYNYATLKAGAAYVDTLRGKIVPVTVQSAYETIAGKDFAERLETYTIDDVLSVVIEPYKDGFRWDIVFTHDVLGNPEGSVVRTRPECERKVLSLLNQIGCPAQEAEDYDGKDYETTHRQIRVNGACRYVHRMPAELLRQIVGCVATVLAENNIDDIRFETVCAALLDTALHGQALTARPENKDNEQLRQNHNIILAALAELNFSDVNNDLLKDYAFRNGVDLTPFKLDHVVNLAVQSW